MNINSPSSPSGRTSSPDWHLLILSAKSGAALDAIMGDTVRYLSGARRAGIGDVAFTLAAGRELFNLRRAVICRSLEDALDVLQGRDADRLLQTTVQSKNRPVAFTFTGRSDLPFLHVPLIYGAEPAFREAADRALAVAGATTDGWADAFLQASAPTVLKRPDTARAASFVFEYALAAMWHARGVVPAAVAGTGPGEAVAGLVSGAFDMDQAVACLRSGGDIRPDPAAAALPLVTYPASEIEDEPVLFEIGTGTVHGSDMKLSEMPDGIFWLKRSLADLTLAGVEIDWNAHYADKAVRRVSMPTYPFEPHKHWFAGLTAPVATPEAAPVAPPAPPAPTPVPAAAPAPVAVAYGSDDIETFLCTTCRDLLGVPAVEPTENIVQLGMDSLNMMQLSRIITEQYEVQISPHHMFSRPDIRSLAKKIAEKRPTGAAPVAPSPAPKTVAAPAAAPAPAPAPAAPQPAGQPDLLSYVAGLSDAEVDQMLRRLGVQEA